jgi:hypothetical protein
MVDKLITNESTINSTVNMLTSLEISKAIAAIQVTQESESLSALTAYITSPFDIPTPKEKVKKRPDGFDYIESSWMDKQFKSHSPLYASEILHYSENHGWITCIVRLTDRISGNSELGGASVRIQVKRDAGPEPSFRDIIDKGNNVAAVITRAIKNAQSRFGIGADIYGKREAVRTEDEKKRFKENLKVLKTIAPNRAQNFQEGWDELGADFSDYLDSWDFFISKVKETKNSTVENVKLQSQDGEVTVKKTSKTITI